MCMHHIMLPVRWPTKVIASCNDLEARRTWQLKCASTSSYMLSTPLQVVMELQSGSDAEAVDLSGDAGVVGRWLVQGSTDSPELLMDLKGVLFSATPVRSLLLGLVHMLKRGCSAHRP